MTTPDQAAALAVYTNEFAGVDKASIFGSGRNFEPGTGRVIFGAAKINHGDKKTFIQECKFVHFRGGVNLDGTRVPDQLFKPGDDASFIVNFAWRAKDSHFKAWGLAVMKALAIKRNQDPAGVTADMITGTTCAQIMATQLQNGLEVDFDAIAQKRKDGGPFTKVVFHGDRATPPAPMTAAPAPAAPAAAPAPAGGDALAELMAQPAPAAAPPTPPAAADPLAAIMGGGASTAPDPLAALMAGGAPAAPAPPTRDQKIAKLRTVPRYATLDFTKATDAQIDAAFALVS
jgi:hypothetical protein